MKCKDCPEVGGDREQCCLSIPAMRQLNSPGPLRAEELKSRLHVVPEKGNRRERRDRAAKRRKG